MEEVLVVPANRLPQPQPTVLPYDDSTYRTLLGGTFRPRDDVEEDESYRQVIPYVILRHAGRVFLMRRTKAGADARLHDRYSIGVGGHVNPVDAGEDPIAACLQREVREEVDAEIASCRPVGFIHAAGNAVERVHTGVLYLAESGTLPRVRETHKLTGQLATLDEVSAVRDKLEGWSQIALQWLEENPAATAV